jgi:hypothetical protein
MEIVIFCFVMLAGVVYGYFTVGGSGIVETPYGKVYGGASGAHGDRAAPPVATSASRSATGPAAPARRATR